jgi:hypothetical protein
MEPSKIRNSIHRNLHLPRPFRLTKKHGHVLGHVKDLGEDPTKTERVRIYRTNGRQFFHTDGADLVGLLCIAKSLEGGESDIVFMHEVFNYLQVHDSEVIKSWLSRIGILIGRKKFLWVKRNDIKARYYILGTTPLEMQGCITKLTLTT